MRGKRRIFAAIFAVALGITGVAIAAGGNDPEIKGTSTELTYDATLNKTQNCLDKNGQATGDKLLSFTLANGSASQPSGEPNQDPALNGTFSGRARMLVDQDDDRATAGFYSISGANARTFAGFGALDRADDEQSDNPPVNLLADDDDLQGFTIGKSYANGQTRLLFGNLTLDIPEAGGTGLSGRIGREENAGDDAALISGFCDVNRDGHDDFDGEDSM